MTAPDAQGLHTLIEDLQREICWRLDRVESSLQRLGVQQDAAPVKAKVPDSEHSSSKSVELPSNSQAQPPAVDSGGTTTVAVTPIGSSHHHDGAFGVAPRPRASLCLRPEWQAWSSEETDPTTVALVKERLGSLDSGATVDRKPWWIVMPNTPFRVCWDLLTSVLIVHDMAVVPVTLAFNTGGNFVTDALFWPFLAFWTIDLPLTFLTGINRNGHVEIRMNRIARSYLRTWFLIDFFVLGATWAEVLFHEDAGEFLLGRMGRTLRVLRVLRTLRFLRFAKLLRITDALSEHVLSEYTYIIMTVAKLVHIVVWLNHFIACGWWALGVNLSDAGYSTTWTSHHRMENATLVFQYFTALHWSLTQFTPAGMEVSPRNAPERIYSVLILLFAMVTFSSFVSSITAAITQLRRLRSNTAANFGTLRRYLRAHELPLDLTVRIMQCVEYRLGQQHKEVQEGEVQYLKFISQPLRMELALHTSGPVLTGHPFLQRYSEVGFEAMRHVCLEALSRCALSTKDTLFDEAEPCERMFFLVSGQLCYTFRKPVDEREAELAVGPADSFVDEACILDEGESCCEVSMWCPWVHCGTMKASSMSEVLALDVAAFTRITCSYKTVNRFTARYAKIFLDSMRRSSSQGTFISDTSTFQPDALDEMVDQASSIHSVHIDAGGESQPAGIPPDGGAARSL